MLSVGIVFMFVAGIAFLGFVIDALFNRIRITSVLPLMLIGLLAGPVLGLINASASSTITQLAPYVAAIAISFVIFDVGINIKLKSLGSVLSQATKFTLLVQITIGLLLSIIVHYAFGWSALVALIFGFAVSGPSSIITPTFVRKLGISDDIKTTLTYESVFSDVLQLVVPLTLLGIFSSSTILSLSIGAIGAEVFAIIFGALLLGAVSALFWLYVLNRFGDYARGYSWMLTITMIIATYGVSEQLGLSSTIAVFVFGLIFANIGFTSSTQEPKQGDTLGKVISKYFAIKQDVEHTIAYQKEIVFFVSTFFFVYVGLLFSLGTLTYFDAGIALLLAFLIILVRVVFLPMLRNMLAKEKPERNVEKSLIYFNVPRGLSSIIIATLLASYGFFVTGFTNLIFLIVLFTNIAFSVGIMSTYKAPAEANGAKQQKRQNQQAQQKDKGKK